MIRNLLLAGLTTSLFWAAAQTSVAADDPKTPAPAAGGISQQTAKINEFIAKGWTDAGIKKLAKRASEAVLPALASICLQDSMLACVLSPPESPVLHTDVMAYGRFTGGPTASATFMHLARGSLARAKIW